MKRFHVMTLNGEHEYDIVVTETDTGRTFELFYSANSVWTKPKSSVMKIKENDKDSSVDLPKGLGKSIGADVVNELSLMLRFQMLYRNDQLALDLHYNVISADGYKI